VAYPQLTIGEQSVDTVVEVAGRDVGNTVRLQFVENRKRRQTCILYLHGLNSYAMEGRFLVPLLGDNLGLCLFDSRAHGKNTTPFVTYGLLESQ
jgi:hypothetical protein